MNERLRKNYQRFQIYTKKLGIGCLLGATLGLLVYREFPYLSILLFVAGSSAILHSAFLKILLFHSASDKEDRGK